MWAAVPHRINVISVKFKRTHPNANSACHPERSIAEPKFFGMRYEWRKTKERSDAGIYYRQRVILSETKWSRSFFERQSEEKPRSEATQGSTKKSDVPYQNKCNIYHGKSDRTVCRSRFGSRLALSLVRLRSTRESSASFHSAQDDT